MPPSRPVTVPKRQKRRGVSDGGRLLGQRLRQLRGQRRLSQEQLAEAAGIHVTYLSTLERGRRNPTLSVLVDLAKALDMSLSELLKGVDT